MTTIPVHNASVAYNPKGLCRIVGFACIAGFLVDLFALTFPPAFGSLEWRAGFMQQVGDRSIILVFGLALITFGFLEARRARKRLALLSLVLGVLLNFSCILVIHDSLALQQQTLKAIATQTTQMKAQIDQAKATPPADLKLTPEQLDKAAQALSSQAAQAKQNTNTSIVKTSVSSVGNLIIAGLALIGLSQFGARPPKIQ